MFWGRRALACLLVQLSVENPVAPQKNLLGFAPLYSVCGACFKIGGKKRQQESEQRFPNCTRKLLRRTRGWGCPDMSAKPAG